jgi:hypothetical protein
MKNIETGINKLYESLKKAYEKEVHHLYNGDLDQCITLLCGVRMQYFSGLKVFSPEQRDFYGKQIDVLEHLYMDVMGIFHLENQKRLEAMLDRDREWGKRESEK